MSSPSISVLKFGTAFRRASTLRQSYLVRQCCRICLIVLRGTPCEKSETVSWSERRVFVRRCLRSASALSGNSTRKGRIAVSAAADVGVVVIWVLPRFGLRAGLLLRD